MGGMVLTFVTKNGPSKKRVTSFMDAPIYTYNIIYIWDSIRENFVRFISL